MYRLNTTKLKKLKEVEEASFGNRLTVLLMCGSFNPIHNAHFGMLDAAKSKLEKLGQTVLGAFISPVSDNYNKPGLISFAQRKHIVNKAVSSHPYAVLDEWEGMQETYTRTYYVLQHIESAVNHFYTMEEPVVYDKLQKSGRSISVVMVCGTDLLSTFFIPKVWSLDILQRLLNSFGIVVVERGSPEFASEAFWRKKFGDPSPITEVIHGEKHSLSFALSNVYFCSMKIKDSTSSTMLRTLVQEYKDGRLEAREELSKHVPSVIVDDVLKIFSV